MKKTIVITGTSRGIGYSIAQRLLQEGHEVIGISRTHTLVHENYTAKVIDLSDTKNLIEKLKALSKEYLEVDSLICNAGKWHYSHFEQLSYFQIQEILHLNFLSQVFLVKAFISKMKERKKGDIFFIGSESGLKGAANQSIYSASKSALRGFAQALRCECATQEIRITLINPGAVKTQMLLEAPFEIGQDVNMHILPEDIAELIAFLLKTRNGIVFDEINLSPQKHRLEKRKKSLPIK